MIEVPTILGSIKALFNENNGIKTFEINIPGNMKCFFDPTFMYFSTIIFNGEKYDSTSGNYKLNAGLNTVELN